MNEQYSYNQLLLFNKKKLLNMAGYRNVKEALQDLGQYEKIPTGLIHNPYTKIYRRITRKWLAKQLAS